MKTKEEIVRNWLPRYTGRELEDFTQHIILTNFQNYIENFAEKFNVPIVGEDKSMPNASAHGITIINFGMGSPNAATIMDLLSAIMPEAVLFLSLIHISEPTRQAEISYAVFCLKKKKKKTKKKKQKKILLKKRKKTNKENKKE